MAASYLASNPTRSIVARSALRVSAPHFAKSALRAERQRQPRGQAENAFHAALLLEPIIAATPAARIKAC